jgi:hypothetical protein
MKTFYLTVLLATLFALAWSYDDCGGQVNTLPLIN